MKKLTIGMIVEGKISGIQPYGAFVMIDENRTGLIHISEISHGFVKDINDFVNVNDRIKAKIIDVDDKNAQISLSLKALNSKVRKENIKHHRKPLVMKIGFKTIEEQLPIWIEETTKEMNND
ncbi:MAG: CvfD/Ygs/GSP13 family RNA-binding post-transcriptional regulator [Erysipelotrichaceae bacterium]|nr:CvfD/Ygs/GSP13 family RNA-binding post-transcriptional regulator [Erysipelotrichaceae bacterium]MDD3923945.1 CvfD/Ygs/GSP13 family RNA-binding post-transcriptional regulator [Erysipelotrichaceae bacterium]MDD4642235.1 CvfD/Ygs/GSP13 family RNA-binding post-transcriptional regulator [Erysipelotrichaceae bacterium]